MRHFFTVLFTFVSSAIWLSLAPAQAALLYAYYDSSNDIVSFDSENPNTILSSKQIGLTGEFEYLIGLDFRPATGQLYSFVNNGGVNMRMFTVDPFTGKLTQVGTSSLAIPAGSNFGLSFAPTSDRLRLVTNLASNTRYNPETGALSGTDTALSYVAGDPAGSASPTITHIAYTSLSTGAAGSPVTTLYGIDTARNTLVRIGGVDGSTSPNGGEVTTIGALGVVGSALGGFAIAPRTNKAYAAMNTGVPAVATLYEINLSNGLATFRGVIGSGSARIGGLAIKDTSSCYDLDGDGNILALTDGLMLLRALLGMTGTSVIANALPSATPPRSTWSAIRAHLNTTCGMSFAP
ncbi:MAG: DUF4394 domain-containing protein [Betaproteobacteria bacterium]|nr:MAG: DUF4394 domain-containing protein [Betaproteobacteria bacterium]